jgi:biotin transporter BioY
MAVDRPTFLLGFLREHLLTRRAIYNALGVLLLALYLLVCALGSLWLQRAYEADQFWVETTTQCPLGAVIKSRWYVDLNQHEPICQ